MINIKKKDNKHWILGCSISQTQNTLKITEIFDNPQKIVTILRMCFGYCEEEARRLIGGAAGRRYAGMSLIHIASFLPMICSVANLRINPFIALR